MGGENNSINSHLKPSIRAKRRKIIIVDRSSVKSLLCVFDAFLCDGNISTHPLKKVCTLSSFKITTPWQYFNENEKFRAFLCSIELDSLHNAPRHILICEFDKREREKFKQ